MENADNRCADVIAIRERMVRLGEDMNMTTANAKILVAETLRFFDLKKDHPEYPSPVAPSAPVDRMWHVSILDTR